MRCAIGLAFGLGLVPGVANAQLPMPEGPRAYLVAPSASTRAEGERLLRVCRWSETPEAATADVIVVVIRSSTPEPLAWHYDSLKWLRDDAGSQLNESGAQYHIYTYTVAPPEVLQGTSHRSYDANPSGSVEGAGGARMPDRLCWSGCGCG